MMITKAKAKMGVVVSMVLAASLVMSLGAAARAGVVASWDPTGLDTLGLSPWDGATLASGVTNPTGLTRGPGFGNPANPTPDDAWGVKGFSLHPTSESEAIIDGYYVTFSLKPVAGYTVSLSSIDAYFRRSSGGAANTFQWMASIGDDTSFTNVDTSWTENATGDPAVAEPTIDVSGVAALQDINQEVFLRLVMWGGTGGAGSVWSLGPNGSALVINGSVVPEPGSLALAVVGLGVTLLRRRRRAEMVA